MGKQALASRPIDYFGMCGKSSIDKLDDALHPLALCLRRQTIADHALLGTQSFVGAALHFWRVDTCSIWLDGEN
jgi:hypothetical protein